MFGAVITMLVEVKVEAEVKVKVEAEVVEEVGPRALSIGRAGASLVVGGAELAGTCDAMTGVLLEDIGVDIGIMSVLGFAGLKKLVVQPE